MDTRAPIVPARALTSALACALIAGCSTAPPTVDPPPLTEPTSDREATAGALPEATRSETFTFQNPGDSFTTQNGIEVTLHHATVGKRRFVDIGLSYRAPGQADVVTSGLGNFLVHGRPVRVEADRATSPGRRMVRGVAKTPLTVTVHLAKSQPVPPTELRAEVDRAAALAHDDGLAFDGYSWRTEPAIDGRIVVAYRTTTTETGLSTVNLVTGEIELTRFKISAMPMNGQARNAPEPLLTLALTSEGELPTEIALREASFRQCLRDTLIDHSIVIERTGDAVSIRDRDDQLLPPSVTDCLAGVVKKIDAEDDFAFGLDSSVDFDTWTEKSAVAGIREAERTSLSVNGPMRSEDIAATLDDHHRAIQHCHLRATWNGARLEGDLALTFKLDRLGVLQRAVVAQHTTPELAALVPCVQSVVQRAGWKPVDRFSTTVDVTYRFDHE